MQIEGIPDGWELVRIGTPMLKEYYIGMSGTICKVLIIPDGKAYAIIRKIKRPKKPKQFRPFANAAEFEPHKKRWLTHPENTVTGEFQVVEFNDNGIWCRGMDDLMPYKHAYKVGLRFDDGSPFGIEVTE